MPYLSKDLIDNALVGRDLDALRRIVGWFIALGVFGFVLNVTAASAIRASRRRSCSTCGCRSTSTCSGCRRASTRAPASATSSRGSTTTSARSSAWPPRRRWRGSATCCSSPAAWCMMIWLDWRLSLIALAPMPISLVALAFYRRRLEGRVAELRQRSADIGSFLIETLQATTLGRRLERAAARAAAVSRPEHGIHRRADADAARDLLRRRAAGHACCRSARRSPFSTAVCA